MNPARALILPLLASLALSQGGCTGSNNGPSNQPGHVMIIGMDGTRAEALQVAKVPNLERLMSTGYSDLYGITGDISFSGPGWSSMLAGVWCDKHNVYDNNLSWNISKFSQFPHFFAHVEQARPDLKTFSAVHWSPVNDDILCSPLAFAGCNRTDKVTDLVSDADVRDLVVNELANGNSDAIFMQFDEIDEAGHGDATGTSTAPTQPGGFCPYTDGDAAHQQNLAPDNQGVCTAANYNAKYVQALERVDGYIGDILNALYKRPNYKAENWLVIVSPDHGGGGAVYNQHGAPVFQDRRTFLIVSGDRAAPLPDGGTATDLPSLQKGVKIVDIAATALHHLHVPIDPAWGLDGQPVGVLGAAPYQERAIPGCYAAFANYVTSQLGIPLSQYLSQPGDAGKYPIPTGSFPP